MATGTSSAMLSWPDEGASLPPPRTSTGCSHTGKGKASLSPDKGAMAACSPLPVRRGMGIPCLHGRRQQLLLTPVKALEIALPFRGLGNHFNLYRGYLVLGAIGGPVRVIG